MSAPRSPRRPIYRIAVHDYGTVGLKDLTWVEVDYGIWRSWTGRRMVDGELIPGRRFVFTSTKTYSGRTS